MSMYLVQAQANITDVPSNWGGIIPKLYFGQFVNLVKFFIDMVNGATIAST
jgi:hypothetical protein